MSSCTKIKCNKVKVPIKEKYLQNDVIDLDAEIKELLINNIFDVEYAKALEIIENGITALLNEQDCSKYKCEERKWIDCPDKDGLPCDRLKYFAEQELNSTAYMLKVLTESFITDKNVNRNNEIIHN